MHPRAWWQDLAGANDPLGLVDGELRSLDEIGEVRLEEGEGCRQDLGWRRQAHRDVRLIRPTEVLSELIEPLQAGRIPLASAGPGNEKPAGAPSHRSSSGDGADDVPHELGALWHTDRVRDLDGAGSDRWNHPSGRSCAFRTSHSSTSERLSVRAGLPALRRDKARLSTRVRASDVILRSDGQGGSSSSGGPPGRGEIVRPGRAMSRVLLFEMTKSTPSPGSPFMAAERSATIASGTRCERFSSGSGRRGRPTGW